MPNLQKIARFQVNRWAVWVSIFFIYLGFYMAFNTVQVISRQVVGRVEETSTYSSSEFCTVNCRPMASNYQLSHLRPCRESEVGGESVTTLPPWPLGIDMNVMIFQYGLISGGGGGLVLSTK